MNENPQPNILLLFPDQWRWDWLGCEISPYGRVPVQTPHIDRLAREGLRLSGCRSNSPVCSPARGCLAQGLRYHRAQVASNEYSTPLHNPSIFRLLREAGYHTMTCGKSDLFKPLPDATQTGFLPIMDALGFSDGIDSRGKGDSINRARKGIDEPYSLMLRERGLLNLHLDDHPAQPLDRAAYPTPLPRDAYTDDFCGQNALRLLERAPAGKPWLLWVNFPGPHDPYDPPAEVLARYDGIGFPAPVNPNHASPAHRNPVADRRHYAACCSSIDDWVGRLLGEVERRGERDNTLIVFASDHGEMLGDHGRWAKSIWFEGSIRVPLILAGPGVAEGHSTAIVELIDVAATLLDIGGVNPPDTWDARTLRPLLQDASAAHRDFAVSQLKDWRCLTTNEWKLVETGSGEGETLLFNLVADPAELNNVAVQHSAQCAEFSSLLDRENPWLE